MRFASLGSLFLALHSIAFAQDLRVITPKPQLLFASGGRVSWGVKNNLIAFDALNSQGYYDVYTSYPDGTNVVCITCNSAQLPAFNKGNPEWHPGNQFLALEVQTTAVSASSGDFSLYTPGVGIGNDLYLTDAAGSSYWPVTSDARGVLHPRFSHDGTKLLWVQRSFGNNWNLMLGDFASIGNVPSVTNIRSLPPCQNFVFCETGGFSEDDQSVYFTSNLDGQSNAGIDIYSYNLQTEALQNLSNSPDNWDEFPMSAPNSNKIVWMSGSYSPSAGLLTDYWMMDPDGSNKTQLTYFNDPYAPAWSLGVGVACAKFNWNSSGNQIVSYFIPTGKSVGQSGSIYLLNFEPAAPTLSAASFRRPPLSDDSIATTFYPNLSSGTDSAASSSLPVGLSDATIEVTDAQGAVRTAPLFFVSPGQINWEMPPGTSQGPATVEFVKAGVPVVRSTVNVMLSAPGIFTADASGSGAPAGYVQLYPVNSTTPSSTQLLYSCSGGTCLPPAISLGSSIDQAFLILFATGLRHASTVSVQIGNTLLPVSYSGAQGVYPGLDQVNISVPVTFREAGLTTLTLVADGVSSNTVQINFQ